MKNRKQIYSFTADPELIDNAVAVATSLDKNFSQFVCNAIDEKIKLTDKQPSTITYSPKIEISLKHTENQYFIEIRDNGIGINDEDKNKIFAPYFTSKTSYNSKAFSGYGLFTVKRMIEENHRGKIWFESKYMDFTSFFITLPIQVYNS